MIIEEENKNPAEIRHPDCRFRAPNLEEGHDAADLVVELVVAQGERVEVEQVVEL